MPRPSPDADGPLADVPAVIRHTYGGGTALCVAARLEPESLAALMERIRQETGVLPECEPPAGIEVVRRRCTDAGRPCLPPGARCAASRLPFPPSTAIEPSTRPGLR
ncbi:hypothetical protein GCM10009540_37500 [Streptomyces turgidiscabies]